MKRITAFLLSVITAAMCIALSGGAGAFYDSKLQDDPDDPFLPLIRQACEAAEKVWRSSGSEAEFEKKADNIYYYLFDMNGDLIPELIFGDAKTAAERGVEAEIAVTDIYTIVDGKPVKTHDDKHWDFDRVLNIELFEDGPVRITSTDGETVCYTVKNINKDATMELLIIFHKKGETYYIGGFGETDSPDPDEIKWSENYDYNLILNRDVDGYNTGANIFEPEWKRIDEYMPGEYAKGFGGRKLEEMTNAYDTLSTDTKKKKEYYTDKSLADMEANPREPYAYIIKERFIGILNPPEQVEGASLRDDFEFARFGRNYYCFYDINGDGTDELLLGCYTPVYDVESGKSVFAFVNDSIYTIKDGEVKTILDRGGMTKEYFEERTIYTNGIIRTKHDYPYEPSYSYIRIEDGEAKSVLDIEYDERWEIYYAPPKYIGWFYENDTRREEILTVDEFVQIKEEAEKGLVPVELDWRPLEEYARARGGAGMSRYEVAALGIGCVPAVAVPTAVICVAKKRKRSNSAENN